MRKHGLGKMPTWQRWLTISSLIICSISGIAFLMGHEFQISRQTLGNHSVLALHGIASALALIAFDCLLASFAQAGINPHLPICICRLSPARFVADINGIGVVGEIFQLLGV